MLSVGLGVSRVNSWYTATERFCQCPSFLRIHIGGSNQDPQITLKPVEIAKLIFRRSYCIIATKMTHLFAIKLSHTLH